MSLYDLSPLEFSSEFDFVPDLREPSTDRPNGRGVYDRYPSYEDPNYPNRVCAPSADRTGYYQGDFVRSPYDLNPLKRRIDDVTMVCPTPASLPRPAPCYCASQKISSPAPDYETFNFRSVLLLLILVLVLVCVPATVGGLVGGFLVRSSRDDRTV